MGPSRTNLILFTALAITALISLPRFLFWQRMATGRFSFEVSLADLLLRALYIFLTSVLFFIIHLQTRTIRIGSLTIDSNSFWQRLPVSIIAFIIIDALLLRFHKLLFPPANEQLFRFLFNINLMITVIMTILFAQIF